MADDLESIAAVGAQDELERQQLEAAQFAIARSECPAGGYPPPPLETTASPKVVYQGDFDNVVVSPTGTYAQVEVTLADNGELKFWSQYPPDTEPGPGNKGDITVDGGGTWTINSGVVTTTKMGGDVTTAGKALLDDTDAAAQRTTLGLGALSTLGTVGASEITSDAVTDTKIRDSAALSVIGRATNSTGDPADIAAGVDGDVLRRSGTTLGFGTVATAGLANDAVTNPKLADMAASTIKGRASGAGTGDPTDLSGAQVATILSGLVVPASHDHAGEECLIDDSGFATNLSGASITHLQRLAEWVDATLKQAAMVLHFVIGSGVAWAVPASEAVFFGSFAAVTRVNLARFTQVRFHVKKNVAASGTTIIALKYATSFTTTIGSYSDIGTSAVEITLSTGAGAVLDSTSWVALAAGAKGGDNVYVVPTGRGGDGATNPNFITVYAEFR